MLYDNPALPDPEVVEQISASSERLYLRMSSRVEDQSCWLRELKEKLLVFSASSLVAEVWEKFEIDDKDLVCARCETPELPEEPPPKLCLLECVAHDTPCTLQFYHRGPHNWPCCRPPGESSATGSECAKEAMDWHTQGYGAVTEEKRGNKQVDASTMDDGS